MHRRRAFLVLRDLQLLAAFLLTAGGVAATGAGAAAAAVGTAAAGAGLAQRARAAVAAVTPRANPSAEGRSVPSTLAIPYQCSGSAASDSEVSQV
jgi:hypothetical protein